MLLVLASQWYKNHFVAICKVPITLIVNLNYLFNKGFCDKKKNTFIENGSIVSVVAGSLIEFHKEDLETKVIFNKR